MFTLEDVKEFLTELGITINEENIKWGYTTLIKEMKTFVKVRKFEKKYNESIFDSCCDDDCCCNGSCECSEK